MGGSRVGVQCGILCGGGKRKARKNLPNFRLQFRKMEGGGLVRLSVATNKLPPKFYVGFWGHAIYLRSFRPPSPPATNPPKILVLEISEIMDIYCVHPVSLAQPSFPHTPAPHPRTDRPLPTMWIHILSSDSHPPQLPPPKKSLAKGRLFLPYFLHPKVL